MITRSATSLLAILFAAPLMASPLGDVVSVDVLPGWRTDQGTHMAALRIELAPGWKTYWRAPGDAGIPPSFDWSGSENIASAEFHWPSPDVFWSNGMRSIGYDGSVVIPVEFALNDAAGPAHVSADVQLGVCEEICVPVHVSFEAELPASGPRDPHIIGALLDRPASADESGVGNVSCAIAPNDNGLEVTTRVEMDALGDPEIVVIEAGDQRIWVSEPESWRDGGALMATAQMIHANGGGFAVQRSDIRITVIAGRHTVDIQGCEGG